MAPFNTISAAFLVLLCSLCSQALAVPTSNDFDYYSLLLTWPAAYCYESKAGCCLPTVGKPALDFFITGLQTRDGITGEEVEVSKCKKSNFHVHELANLTNELYAYWNNIKCPSTNPLSDWKNSWKTNGVCSGLSEHDYFKTALKLRKKLDLLSIFKKNGIVPSGENFYNVQHIRKVIEKTLGTKVAILCNKNMWDESQFHQIYICFDKTASTFIDCHGSGVYDCAKEVTFGLFTYDMLASTAPKLNTIRMHTED